MLRLSAVALVTLLAVPSTAQQLVRSLPGPAANAEFGRACADIGDRNNDGYDDLLVGAPGFNQGRGAIYCVSGAYLATGNGASVLFSFAAPGNQGDRFGHALASLGDVSNDGVGDFAVGQPGRDLTSSQDVGAVHLVDGATFEFLGSKFGLQTGAQFGSSVAACGDLTGDGRSEIAAGAPGPNSSESSVSVLEITGLFSQPVLVDLWHHASDNDEEFGAAVASGFDFDGDGWNDVVAGRPGDDSNTGEVWILDGLDGGFLDSYDSPIPGERFGQALDAAHDYDGDGAIDIVVGAPKSPGLGGTGPGRALVLSSGRIHNNTPPFEIFTLSPAAPGLTPISMHFGSAVRASRDLTGDGVGEILVGAPDFATTIPIGPDKGAVSIYSGSSGARIGGLVGASHDRLGDSLAGAVEDLDGDGFREFVVLGSTSNVAGADSGVLKCYRLFPTAPSTYCTGKQNSPGCTPAIASSGSPSASSSTAFLITASNFLNQKTGLLFYSHAPTTASFQGGFKCVANPTFRTPPQGSGGSASGTDCSGTYSFDFNAWTANGLDPTTVAGAEIFAQYWSRDPASPSHTGLSNAIRFVINP